MVDATRFTWSTKLKCWWQRLDASGLELCLAGSESEISEKSLLLAERILPDIQILLDRSKGYLDAFIVPEKFGAAREWHIGSINVGSETTPEIIRVEFNLEGDTYGLWSVEFTLDSRTGFQPQAFGRRNY